MRIVFNSFNNSSPATIFYKSGISRLENVFIDDFNNYSQYDYAIFMGFNEDLTELIKAKHQNDNILCGVIDPRGDNISRFYKYLDFIVVDSIEMSDFFSKYQVPIFRYYEYMLADWQLKKHAKKNKIIIGYHGNKIHLMSMFPNITQALDMLSLEYSVEFHAIYNIKQLGEWRLGLPENIIVKHIQLDDNYIDYIDKFDIGIVPATLPFFKKKSILKSSIFFRHLLNCHSDDYLFRFKLTTNSGRIILFALRGIPVVSDMFPSAIELLQHGKNGYLAASSSGWYNALRDLTSPDKRNKVSVNLKENLFNIVDYDIQNKKFCIFLDELSINPNKSIINFNERKYSIVRVGYESMLMLVTSLFKNKKNDN